MNKYKNKMRIRTLIETETGKKMILGTLDEIYKIISFINKIGDKRCKILKMMFDNNEAFVYILMHPEVHEIEYSDIKTIL